MGGPKGQKTRKRSVVRGLYCIQVQRGASRPGKKDCGKHWGGNREKQMVAGAEKLESCRRPLKGGSGENTEWYDV